MAHLVTCAVYLFSHPDLPSIISNVLPGSQIHLLSKLHLTCILRLFKFYNFRLWSGYIFPNELVVFIIHVLCTNLLENKKCILFLWENKHGICWSIFFFFTISIPSHRYIPERQEAALLPGTGVQCWLIPLDHIKPSG